MFLCLDQTFNKYNINYRNGPKNVKFSKKLWNFHDSIISILEIVSCLVSFLLVNSSSHKIRNSIYYLEKKLNASAHFVCNYFYQLLLVRNCITLVLKIIGKTTFVWCGDCTPYCLIRNDVSLVLRFCFVNLKKSGVFLVIGVFSSIWTSILIWLRKIFVLQSTVLK